MENLIKACSAINKYICSILLLTMVLLVFANTVLRYFFDGGIIITEEFVRYLFLWAIYLGVISVWFTRGHIRVTTVTDKLSPRGRVKNSIFCQIVSIIVLIVLGFGSCQYFMDTTTVGQVTGIPYSILILALIVGSFASCVISVMHISEDMKLLKLSNDELLALEQEEERKRLQGE